jgi:hypothetical protein
METSSWGSCCRYRRLASCCSNTLSASWAYSAQLSDDLCIMNWKWFGIKSPCLGYLMQNGRCPCRDMNLVPLRQLALAVPPESSRKSVSHVCPQISSECYSAGLDTSQSRFVSCGPQHILTGRHVSPLEHIGYCTTWSNITELCTFPHAIFIFRTILVIISDYFPVQDYPIVLCNGDNVFCVR